MPSVRTETETVVKRILPYLRRRGYTPETDIDFETPVQNPERYSLGYVDLLVTCGLTRPMFVIEAKRNGRRLTQADERQARTYGQAVAAPFVVVTNGTDVRVLNTVTGEPLRWNGRLADKIPSRDQVNSVVSYLRRNRHATDVPLGSGDASLPFRPALPLKQLNDLFARCHNKIRNIEKNEEHAFADFSKFLFLKLLEEKADEGDFTLPYSFRFWELAERPSSQADQVQSAIGEMLGKIRERGYGDVLHERLHLRQPATFHYLVTELAKVSFADSGLDVKGTAFEYFVRATLKGKRLGQYFTPRQVVDVMAGLVGRRAIVTALTAGQDVRVADPACGTGGFLVYLLKASLSQLDTLVDNRSITQATRDALAAKLKQEVFHGSDANDGVASAAKMNMIIAGDGHNNIRSEDSLRPDCSLWPIDQDARFDFILTNPPFGTSETDSLPRTAATRYPVTGGKGQHLFLQRMVMATKPGGLICTVIDEGLLNTDGAASLREWVMQQAQLLAVLQLPEETFKPNKINVRSSVLLLRRRASEDRDLLDDYPITVGSLDSLGYVGSGESIRGFDFDGVRDSIEAEFLNYGRGSTRLGPHWSAFEVRSVEMAQDKTKRWDRKYWAPQVRGRVDALLQDGAPTLQELNTVTTRRGKSPAASSYVDETDGYALVVKAGSNISRFGELVTDNADWIEKAAFDDLSDDVKLQLGDVLIASTGDGTLGKACVFDADVDAVADGHVTIIRPDPAFVDSYYLADYLRCGFGHEQINRLFTGSTGLIELTAEHVNRIAVHLPATLDEQVRVSRALRAAETGYLRQLEEAQESLASARTSFDNASTVHAA